MGTGIGIFVAETLSHSSAKKTGQKRKDIYEQAGVEEYWIVSPQGSVEIYYLQDDKEDEEYNAELEICLKAFPHIKMSLGEIFEGVY